MTSKQETFEQLIELQKLMAVAHHKHLMQHGPMADATRGKGRVLALLKMKDGIATRDMANVLGIRVSSLNETLARLEAEGYVERKAAEQDRRIMLVYLTEKGQAEEQPQNDLPNVLFEGFEDNELDTLQGFLNRMSAAVETQLGPDWREHMHHMRNRREQIFHQAADHGRPPFEHGPHGGRGPHEGFDDPPDPRRGRGHGYGGNFGGPNERYPREAELETCDHNCRACTRDICVRHMR